MRQTSGINPLFSFPFLLLLVVSGFGKVSSTNEVCTDALGRECFRYKDEDCVGVYETWARANCSLRCGYCPQKLPCVDNINYCSQFGADVCQQEFYGQYLRENCRKTCNFCRAPTEYLVSSTTSTTTPVSTTKTATYNPAEEWCRDRLISCWRYPAEMCIGFYEKWFRKNCPFRCGYCPNLLPPCVDQDERCEHYSLEACTNLTYRAYMRENCRKRCNECHYPGQNLVPNTPPYGFYTTTTTTVRSTRKAMTVSTTPGLIVPTEISGNPVAWPRWPENKPQELQRVNITVASAPTEYLVSSTTSTTTPVSTTQTTTYNLVWEWCRDKIYNCWRYPAEKCILYENWFRKNCPFRCGYCPNLLPPCVDLDPNCEAYSLEACTNLTYRAYMRETCRKRCNECKYPGQNLAPNKPPGVYTTTTTRELSTRKVMAVSTKPVFIVPTERWALPIRIPTTEEFYKPQKLEGINITEASDIVSVIGNSHLLQQNEAFNVSCRITGYNQASDVNDTSSVEWLFNGQRISYLRMVSNANKYRLHVKTTNMYLEVALEIPAVVAEDSGNYTCVFGNRANKNHFQQKSWHLHVICVDCSQTIVG